MAPPTAGVHIVIVGGVSVNDPGDHDQFPYNFINPAARRAIAFKGNTHVLMFTPPYEKRVREQKKEHSTVKYSVVDECSLPLSIDYCPRFLIHKAKNPYHFLDVMKGSGSKNGFTVTSIATADELTAAIDGFPAIETIHYFGHSNPGSMFLQYSTTGHLPAVGEVVWDETDAKKIKPAKFTAGATFASYGCNQGEVGGLADRVRDLWKIRTIGSQGKTDFETIGQGQTFPKSAGGYYEYPTPTLAADGKTWSYPARRALTAPF